MKANEKILRNNKGITLVALVVTIIVLLILAAVSLSSVFSDKGIFSRAETSALEHRAGTVEDEVTIWKNEKQIAKYEQSAVAGRDEIIESQKARGLLTGKEAETAKTTGKVKIGTKTIDYGEDELIIPKVDDTTPGEFEGDGSEEKPYKVSSIEDLVAMSQNVEKGETYEGKKFELTTNLSFQATQSYVDATRTDMGDVNENGKVEPLIEELTTGKGFKSIGRSADGENGWIYTYFDGKFDGNNHTIAHFYQNIEEHFKYSETSNKYHEDEEGYGLFGLTNKGLTVKNLKMSSVDIQSEIVKGEVGKDGKDTGEIGAILGAAWKADSVVVIENCTVDGKIKASGWRLGGLVGSAWGNVTIRNCTNYAEIFGYELVGGIIGQNCDESLDGVMEKCVNYGRIECVWNHIGGIVGQQFQNTKDCINYGTIDCDSSWWYEEGVVGNKIGGIAGNSGGDIENCYNFANISVAGESEEIGGLVGEYYARNKDTAYSIKKCYNKGNIIAKNGTSIGGIVGIQGENSWKGCSLYIENCYNKGNVQGKEEVGGLIGHMGSIYNYSTPPVLTPLYIKNCYNTGRVEGSSKVGGIAGLLLTETGSTIENAYYLNTASQIDYTTDKEETFNTRAKTAQEMTDESFVNLLNTGNTEITWKKDSENENNGYPIL